MAEYMSAVMILMVLARLRSIRKTTYLPRASPTCADGWGFDQITTVVVIWIKCKELF